MGTRSGKYQVREESNRHIRSRRISPYVRGKLVLAVVTHEVVQARRAELPATFGGRSCLSAKVVVVRPAGQPRGALVRAVGPAARQLLVFFADLPGSFWSFPLDRGVWRGRAHWSDEPPVEHGQSQRDGSHPQRSE